MCIITTTPQFYRVTVLSRPLPLPNVLNRQLPIGSAHCGTSLTPGPVVPGESGFSLTDEVFTGADHLKPLFKPADYLECEDETVKEVYEAMQSGAKPKHLSIDGYHLTGDGYLLRLTTLKTIPGAPSPSAGPARKSKG